MLTENNDFMRESLDILGRVKQEEIVVNLLKFYSRVEKLLSTRLPHYIWSSHDKTEGAKEALDCWLRKIVEDDLQKILPSVGIIWDYQMNIRPIYSTSNVALVDLVDGAKEYLREGTYVTSHIGIYKKEGTEIGDLQIGIVSYPFHRFRVITIGDKKGSPVYYLPFEFDIMIDHITGELEKRRLNSFLKRKESAQLNLVDRYVNYDETDTIRRKLDLLRDKVIQGGGSYTVCRGSVAKTIVDIALGASDVAICKHYPRAQPDIPPGDYLTPSKILENNGGVFVDLNGAKPNKRESIKGFIATANQEIYDLFINLIS